MSNEEIIQELKSRIEEFSKLTSFYDYQKHKLSDGSEVSLVKKDKDVFVIPINNDKPITYKNQDVNIDIGDPRVPNEKERREWIIDRLRYYYLFNRKTFKRQTYRSLKGMVKRGNIEPALRYLELNWMNSVRSRYDEMCQSKTIFTATAHIKFSTPITVESIDIEILKEAENQICFQ